MMLSFEVLFTLVFLIIPLVVMVGRLAVYNMGMEENLSLSVKNVGRFIETNFFNWPIYYLMLKWLSSYNFDMITDCFGLNMDVHFSDPNALPKQIP